MHWPTPRPHRTRSAAALALLLAQTACGAGWSSTPVRPATFPERQQVEIWQGGEAARWHAVRITDSTVTGVHFLDRPDCDSCRLEVPRTAVDSLRTGHPVGGFWKSVGVGTAVALGSVLIVCMTAGCPAGN